MATFDLGSIVRDGKLQFARATAIEAYGNLERSLSLVFASLLGTTNEKAGTVFFRIVNARFRNDIIDDLIKKVHSTKFDAYWNGQPGQSGIPRVPGLFTHIRNLDERRNQIVHWHVVNEIALDSDPPSHIEVLAPPNFWSEANRKSRITVDGINEFIAKAVFVDRGISMFYVMTSGQLPIPAEQAEPWLRIFQQPVPYPPPDTHLLSPNYKAPEIPLQPSGG
jgi:hypothetical protein